MCTYSNTVDVLLLLRTHTPREASLPCPMSTLPFLSEKQTLHKWTIHLVNYILLSVEQSFPDLSDILSVWWSLGKDHQDNQARLDYQWQTNMCSEHQKGRDLKKKVCVDIFLNKSSQKNQNFVGFGHTCFVTYFCFQLYIMWTTVDRGRGGTL